MFEVLSFEMLGKMCVGDVFSRLVTIAGECLPASVYMPSLHDSVRHVAGTVISKKPLLDLCHRLAGNVQALSRRRAVPPWSQQRYLEWVPMQVVSVRKRLNPRIDVPGATLTLKIMAGSAAAMLINKWWSLRNCVYLSNFFGFSRPVSQRAVYPAMYPYEEPSQLVLMRFYGLLDPDMSNDEPGFVKVRFPASSRRWNREQLKYRQRVDESHACPRKYPDDLACHRCPVGYDECRAGTHPSKYVKRKCRSCDKEAPFDITLDVEVCINCVNRDAYRRRKLL